MTGDWLEEGGQWLATSDLWGEESEEGEKAANKLDSRNVTRFAKPRRVALRWAIVRAAGEISVA